MLQVVALNLCFPGKAALGTERGCHTCYANAGHNPGADVLNVMARDAEAKVGKFTAQNMSNTLLAYAKLEHHPGHLMEVMAAEALRKLDQFTPQVCLNTA